MSICLQAVFAFLYCVITDLQQLQEYASLSVQFKMLLCLTALFYLRYKQPNLHRPMKVMTSIYMYMYILCMYM